ncbi:MAG: acetolactate synthase 3 large subunit, partial [Rhodospirillaceae bacterium]|nr:acetolactate synthase 3 large subunit [Rhodospirillaceae bacterium]
RYSESYMESLPDFVKLAESFGAKGLRATKPDELDGVIDEMIASDTSVIVDVCVAQEENVFPMIPSGAAHNEMLFGDEDKVAKPVSEDGMVLV